MSTWNRSRKMDRASGEADCPQLAHSLCPYAQFFHSLCMAYTQLVHRVQPAHTPRATFVQLLHSFCIAFAQPLPHFCTAYSRARFVCAGFLNSFALVDERLMHKLRTVYMQPSHNLRTSRTQVLDSLCTACAQHFASCQAPFNLKRP